MSLTGAASNGFGQEPMSVTDIVKLAANYEYSDDIALKYWLRTADAIQKQVLKASQYLKITLHS